MSEPPSTRSPRRSSKRSEPRTLLKFVEELSWLLSSYEDLDFRALGSLGAEFTRSQKAATNLRNHTATSRPPTAQLLVGTLPGLLRDESLFPSNEDIVEFSTMTLGMTIPRWQKKSKYELIGHIVCHTDSADQTRLDSLVQILDSIMSDRGEAKRQVEEQRKSGLSWNEVIQKLLKTNI
jgi:hypothetical protein